MDPITSYAQNFEDVMLWRALGDVERGFYIDIGAQSPLVDSVSLAFHVRGWRGIHVEPNASYARELREARKGDIVVEAVVTTVRGMSEFYAIPGTGLSTAVHDIAAGHEDAGFDAQRDCVPAVTLDDVFEMAGDIEVHWLKVDVEGSEREVLQGWSSSQRPWVVVIESVHPLNREPTHGDWEYLLLERGYACVYADGLNRFYLHDSRDELRPRFTSPPNVFDGFKLSGTSTAPFVDLKQQVEDAEDGAEASESVGVHDGELRRDLFHVRALLRAREEAFERLIKQYDSTHHQYEHFEWLSRHRGQAAEAAEARAHVSELRLAEATAELREKNIALASAGDELRELLGLSEKVEGLERAVRDAERIATDAMSALKREYAERLARLEAAAFESSRAATKAIETMASQHADAMSALKREYLDRLARLEAAVLESNRWATDAIKSMAGEHAERLAAQELRLDRLQRQLQDSHLLSFEATRNSRQMATEQADLLMRLFRAEEQLAILRVEKEKGVETLQAERAFLAEMARDVQRLEEETQTLRQREQMLLQSRSWRVTAPVRVVTSLLRGNVRELTAAAARRLASLDPYSPIRRVLRWLLPQGSRLGDLSRRLLSPARQQPPVNVRDVLPVASSEGGELGRLLSASGVSSAIPRIRA